MSPLKSQTISKESDDDSDVITSAQAGINKRRHLPTDNNSSDEYEAEFDKIAAAAKRAKSDEEEEDEENEEVMPPPSSSGKLQRSTPLTGQAALDAAANAERRAARSKRQAAKRARK